ncbi:MAG TPA: UDP-N-acetylmuramate dehydrogenase [Acidimicrobiales bacterium]
MTRGDCLQRALEAADAVFRARGLHERVRSQHPLGPLTTYRVGGAAARFLVASSLDDLLAVAEAAKASGLPVLVIGRGSNLLVADRGVCGIVVQLGNELAHIDINAGDNDDRSNVRIVRAGGAASLPVVARRTASAGCTGFEWAVGVPGSIGGAVRMNAGGHGSDMAAVVTEATIVDVRDGRVERRTADALRFGYRTSSVRDTDVVIDATLRLAPGDPDTSLRTIDDIVRWRRENQPGGQNAGSVFTNPPGDSAGRLIDTAGCKGMRVGSAHVSTKHANFIQVDDGGSADDVHALMRLVHERVLEVHGVDLVPETRMVGFTDERWAETENRR